MCLVTHSSPRRLAGEKKVTAIIMKQQLGFPLGLLKSWVSKILSKAFWVIAILEFSPYVARVDFKGLMSK